MNLGPVMGTSAWLAFALWIAAEWASCRTRVGLRGRSVLWVAGAAAMTVHQLLAFGLRHQWSHAAAVEETARQTSAVFGISWGGGVWFNYLMVVWWWRQALAEIPRLRIPPAARSETILRRGFFAMMWFNGAVVFVSGWRRWVGLGLTLIALVTGYREWRNRRRE